MTQARVLASLNHRYVVRYYDCFIGAALRLPAPSRCSSLERPVRRNQTTVAETRSVLLVATVCPATKCLVGLVRQSRELGERETKSERMRAGSGLQWRPSHHMYACVPLPCAEGKMLNIVMSLAAGGTIHHVVKVCAPSSLYACGWRET